MRFIGQREDARRKWYFRGSEFRVQSGRGSAVRVQGTWNFEPENESSSILIYMLPVKGRFGATRERRTYKRQSDNTYNVTVTSAVRA